MRSLFVAAQNLETREWIPVAVLRESEDGYELQYTNGAVRVPRFNGLGRMQALDKVYHSKSLFPFFANRVISKSRPEYRDYLRWLGLEAEPRNPLDVLAITGGIRATDSFELIPPPAVKDGMLKLSFFPRGLRYLPQQAIEQLMGQVEGSVVCLMRDVQNDNDPNALAIRTEKSHPTLIGYVPRYYCEGIGRLLKLDPSQTKVTIQRINPDAPLDLKVLFAVEARVPKDFDLLDNVNDFLPLSVSGMERLSDEILSKTDLDI